MRLTTRALAAVAAVAAVGISFVGPASAKVDPNLNKPSFWETEGVTCTKVELTGEVTTWTVPMGSGFVVVKAGTESVVVEMSPFGPTTYESAKGISHVITCTGSYGS